MIMPEQSLSETQQTDDDNILTETSSEAEEITEEFWSWKTMSQYVRELLCLLAFFLTTYATFQNRSQKFSKPPPPTFLFGKNSLVHEYSDGQLDVIQSSVATSELSLIFFYAPWCAESHFAKNIIEYLAEQFSDQIYFAAVNCWQPGGECRMQYPRVDAWPILMAYFPKGFAIQYSGIWNLKLVASFIDKLLNPVQRIETEKDLLKAKLDNYAVVVGYFGTTQPSPEYQVFYQAALRSIEHYPLRGTRFAIVTGETVKLFNISTTPAIQMYSLNTTVMYEGKQWSFESIAKWIQKNFDVTNTWVEISGKKSWNLSNNLKKTPTLLAFYPRHYLGNYNDAYYMLRQVAFVYNDCKLNRSLDFIKSIREENIKQIYELKSKCAQMKQLNDKENILSKQSCNETQLSFIESAKNINVHNNYCSPCDTKFSHSENIKLDLHNDNFISKKSNSFFIDVNDPSYLLQKSLEYKCWKLSLAEKSTDNFDSDYKIHNNFTGMGCKTNRTLTFVMADNDLYNYMMESLGVNSQFKNLSKALVFIVDKEKESTFQMKDEISVSSLVNFIENFHNNSLVRNLRRKDLSQLQIALKMRSSIQIREVNSKQLKEIIKNPKKNIIILFYSSQCALCSIASRTLLNIATILDSKNFQILRIDGENNDFSWEYTMDVFPTLILVPKGRESDTRIFPRNMQLTLRNILRFTLLALNRIDRLNLITEVCESYQVHNLLPNCMRNLRIEIISYIGNILHNISTNIIAANNTMTANDYNFHVIANYSNPMYVKFIKKLEVLNRIYYLTFKQLNKSHEIFKTILKNIVILSTS